MQLHHHALRGSLVATLSFCLAACGDDKGAPDTDGTTTAATMGTTTATTTGPTAGATESVTTGATQDASTSEPSTTDATTSEPSTTEVTAATGSTTDLDTTGMTGMTGQSGLSFAAAVYSVLNPPASCDCHTPGAGGLKMGDVDTAYTNLVSVMSTESPLKRVEPGSADDSYMWHKINGTHVDVGGSGQAMPLGAPPLPQETLDLIKEWIDGGAQP